MLFAARAAHANGLCFGVGVAIAKARSQDATFALSKSGREGELKHLRNIKVQSPNENFTINLSPSVLQLKTSISVAKRKV